MRKGGEHEKPDRQQDLSDRHDLSVYPGHVYLRGVHFPLHPRYDGLCGRPRAHGDSGADARSDPGAYA